MRGDTREIRGRYDGRHDGRYDGRYDVGVSYMQQERSEMREPLY